MQEDLAIFMDWENIYISTVQEYKTKPNVSAILEKAREFGRIVSASAYADWTDGEFRSAPPTLYSNGIAPRYISARYFPGGRSQKRRTNSIDVMLAVECSDFLHNHPQVDTYVLVTGDGDFIPLVSLLRSRGKKVVVIGVSEATSYHLIESADHFISYASLFEEDRAAKQKDRKEPKPKADPYQELVRAVGNLKRGGKTRVLGQVKQQMIVQLGSFDERNVGFKKFKDFVVEAEKRGLVNTVDEDLELHVYLPDEDIPDPNGADLSSEEPAEAKQQTRRGDGNGGAQPAGEDRESKEAKSGGKNGSSEGRPVTRPSERSDGFDLLSDLTPYELKTICENIEKLRSPASMVEIFGSIRDLDDRGELELSRDEISEVITAMIEADFLSKVRVKPYKEARSSMTFYKLESDREEVQSALQAG
ncbi:NYN domain [Rubrobacter radiotolerans]|uniref:NYN domain n=1 Tax=Rubrobacter radiotolerans TaxID=42256 RepID=A0A023WZ95_RUBRA|nr:NYN domain-containing protein [Rubrobacter radiotolerans]AHY45291.1 NYN domain [Rubrobacter radiotolerans]MDX5892703.1 NYN domain-containing protein [Rubrobacter radiotolerans]SMC02317.1 TIGR00288 family protein [Rubrobacter radiotolerans DSM 5868]